MSGYALDTVDPSVRLIPDRGVFDILNQVRPLHLVVWDSGPDSYI